MLQEYNGLKEIFCNNFFMRNIKSYHPLRANDPYISATFDKTLLIHYWKRHVL